MTWRNRWVVLVPGKVAWIEARTRDFLEANFDLEQHTFTIIPGQKKYHAVVETGDQNSELEIVLGDMFSRLIKEPVYSIEAREDAPDITRFLKGEETRVNRDPESLVRSLGCKVPWFDEPPPPPLKLPWATVVLIQGLEEAQVRNALARRYKHLRPEDFVITKSPKGLLMRDERGWLGMAMADLSFRFPSATIYTVWSKPDLRSFRVNVSHRKQDLDFVLPPGSGVKGLGGRDVTEILGEREPERILAALGIPPEWFEMRDDLPAGVAPKAQGS